jgi:UDP-N-acetyl-D-galactosamine dehydrogenase
MKEVKIAIIGLGYVGLPLAIEFAKKYSVMGFDIDQRRIQELQSGFDRTKEADIDVLKSVISSPENNNGIGLLFSANLEDLSHYNIFIVTVPTPIDEYNAPDLMPLLKASEMIGKVLKKNDIVIYESTVYPGCTEEDCVPVLEKNSSLKYNIDFFCGYSPERINPGDKINTLAKIVKVTSGSNLEISKYVNQLYASIITAGTYMAPSIKVAEASKAIENAQRDINISFMNELALIFDRMGIDTTDVIEAAATKWNFLKYKQGLVGGHCIGVDPYYLAHKAASLDYYPQVILSGRRVNDNIAIFIANKVIKLMINKGAKIKGSKVLILGFSFKENCPDFRNTKVINIHKELIDFGCYVDIFDPHVDASDVLHEFNLLISNDLGELSDHYDAIILAVSHSVFLNVDFKKYVEGGAIIYDVKSFLPREIIDSRL